MARIIKVFLFFFILSSHCFAQNNEITKANDFYVKGKYSEAEVILKKILISEAKNSRIQALLSLSLTRQGKHEEAISHYKIAIELGATTYDVCALYAISLDALGMIDESIKWNKRALKIAPSLMDVSKTLAKQLENKGNIKDAISILETFDSRLIKLGKKTVFDVDIELLKEKILDINLVVTPPRLPLDFASMVAAKKKASSEQDLSPESVGKQEDANAKATRIAKQNLASATAPAFGYDPSKSGGVFQIKTHELTFASFVFNGSFNETSRTASQLYEVHLGDNSNIELAVARKMIQLIRQHEKGDFKWNNPQKGRTTTLSAREKDTELLEKFLINEFF